jgi:hypothetical protein
VRKRVGVGQEEGGTLRRDLRLPADGNTEQVVRGRSCASPGKAERIWRPTRRELALEEAGTLRDNLK